MCSARGDRRATSGRESEGEGPEECESTSVRLPCRVGLKLSAMPSKFEADDSDLEEELAVTSCAVFEGGGPPGALISQNTGRR